MDYKKLIRCAVDALDKSYSPYSGFAVGAALLCNDGTIYTGCNIENAAFSPTNCAERTAFFKAVSEGQRSFAAIAVVASNSASQAVEAAPCGVCRQVMREFCGPEFKIIIAKSEADYQITTLCELLPKAFGPDNLA